MPTACMTRATPGGRPDGSGGGGGGGPSDGGASLAVRELRSAKRCASSSADGPPAPVTSAHISSKPASTKCSASWTRPLSASRRPAASAARRMMPDAQMSLKTPRSSRRRYMRRASPSSSSNSARCSSGTCDADVGDARVDLVGVVRRRRRPTIGSSAAARRAARARSARRCRSRRAADSRRGRDTPTSRRRPRRRTRAARRASCRGRRRSRGARGPPGRSLIAAMSRSSSPDAPADTGAAPRIIASASAGATSVHAPRCASRSPTGSIADAGEAHVLEDHLRVVLATAGRGTRPARRRRARRRRPPAARGGS